MAILQRNFGVGIVLDEAVLLFVVRVTPGGAFSIVFVEGFQKGGRTRGLEVAGRDVDSSDER